MLKFHSLSPYCRGIFVMKLKLVASNINFFQLYCRVVILLFSFSWSFEKPRKLVTQNKWIVFKNQSNKSNVFPCYNYKCYLGIFTRYITNSSAASRCILVPFEWYWHPKKYTEKSYFSIYGQSKMLYIMLTFGKTQKSYFFKQNETFSLKKSSGKIS